LTTDGLLDGVCDWIGTPEVKEVAGALLQGMGEALEKRNTSLADHPDLADTFLSSRLMLRGLFPTLTTKNVSSKDVSSDHKTENLKAIKKAQTAFNGAEAESKAQNAVTPEQKGKAKSAIRGLVSAFSENVVDQNIGFVRVATPNAARGTVKASAYREAPEMPTLPAAPEADVQPTQTKISLVAQLTQKFDSKNTEDKEQSVQRENDAKAVTPNNIVAANAAVFGGSGKVVVEPVVAAEPANVEVSKLEPLPPLPTGKKIKEAAQKREAERKATTVKNVPFEKAFKKLERSVVSKTAEEEVSKLEPLPPLLTDKEIETAAPKREAERKEAEAPAVEKKHHKGPSMASVAHFFHSVKEHLPNPHLQLPTFSLPKPPKLPHLPTMPWQHKHAAKAAETGTSVQVQ